MKKLSIVLFITICLLFKVNSQTYPQDFIFPLKVGISLSTNYSALRKNHFHSGIDIRTQQREGLNVYAVQEGYISRINISSYGYGKAIYITHPNGYTSVYGHLKSFNEEIENRAREEQYKKKSFSVDFTLSPKEITVKKGQKIALSGNTGGSGGPHVHFEIRDSKTEETLNPFLFGFTVPDHIRPTINEVWIYPLGNNSRVSGLAAKKKITEGSITNVSGRIGFGINTFDRLDGATNFRHGAYTIKTYVDKQLFSEFKTDKFAFSESQMINASTDYHEYIVNNKWIYRTYLLPGNYLQMYKVENRGILEVEEGKVYTIKIIVGDFSGNTTTYNFKIKGSRNVAISDSENCVSFDKNYTIEKDGIYTFFNKNIFYEDFCFNYDFNKDKYKYQLHYSDVPLNSKFTLKINPDWNQLDQSKRDKYIILWESNKGKYKKEYLVTEYKQGNYVANPKNLGNFSLVLDENIPTISSPTLSKNNKVNNYLSFIIKDSESGIKTYDVFIDDQWILAEYDYKTNKLFIPNLSKEGISSGNHEVKVIVIDEVGNKNTFIKTFVK